MRQLDATIRQCKETLYSFYRVNIALPNPYKRVPSMLWAVLLPLVFLLAALSSSSALADTTPTLFKSFAGNLNFVGTEHTLRTQSNSAGRYSWCTVTTNPTTASLSGIPSGATIKAAYLYWAGSGATPDYDVTFDGQPVSAASKRRYTASNGQYFSGVADVTSIVAAKGNGSYSLSNLTVDSSWTYCAGQTVMGGWSLLVIYSAPSETFRVLNLYEGFQPYQNSSITLNLSNFKVPNSFTSGRVAHITWEGDPTLSGGGENLTFNNGNTSYNLTDALNPIGNQFNSQSNINGDTQSYGVDFDAYTLTAPQIYAGETTGSTIYASGQDLVFLSAEVLAVPNVSTTDLGISLTRNANLVRGQNGSYSISVNNNGPMDTPGPITVTDTLPSGLSYVSASGTNWSCSATGKTVTCTYNAAIANGATAPTLTLTAAVAANAPATITNTASVKGTLFDNVTANDTASDTFSFGIATYAYYAMEDGSWNGTSGEVKDSSGNNRNGTAMGNAAITTQTGNDMGYICTGGNIPSDTTSAINTGINPNTIGNTGTIDFWYKSNTAWNSGNNQDGRVLLDASSLNNQFFLYLSPNGYLLFSVDTVRNGRRGRTRTNTNWLWTNIAYTDPANTWVHIAVTWDFRNRSIQIYRGTGSTTSLVGQLSLNDRNPATYGSLYLANANPSGYLANNYLVYSANGIIDESRIYNSVLTQAQIQADMNASHPCGGPSLDHFTFNLGTGTASTCTPRSISITAVDVSGNALTNYTGAIQVSDSSGHGTWSLQSGAGTFSPGASDSGTAAYTFVAGDNGSVTLNLSDTHADDLTITAADNSAAVSSTSGTLSFRDNAFVITPTDALGTTVVAGRPHAMQAALWTKDTNGSCSVNQNYQGSIGLKAWLGRAANDPGGTAPTIGGSGLPNSVPANNNVTLNFTAGVATFSLGTTDVGKFGINLRDDTSKFAQDVNGNARAIDGSTSGDLTVRPFALTLRNIQVASDPANSLCTDPAAVRTNPGTTAATGSLFTCAGYPFQAQTTAVQWQSADDANNDGTPDGGANLADNPATAHFAWNTTITASTPITPAAGVVGSLTGNTLAAGAYSGGSASATALKYGEVGSVTLIPAAAANYLNTNGLTIPPWNSVIGRFIPGQFTVSVSNPGSMKPFCAGNFVYTGQSFGYAAASNPSYLITAQIWQGGATTQNYRGNFMRLTPVGITLAPVTKDGTKNTALSRTAGNPTLNDNSMTTPPKPGTATYTLGADSFTYTRNNSALIAPYMSDIRLSITAVTDQDGVKGSGLPVTAKPLGVKVRYGRVRMQNAHGSELTDLAVPLTIEYYRNAHTGFVINGADICTSGIKITLSDPSSTDHLNATTDTCVVDAAGASGAFACSGYSPSGKNYAQPPTAAHFNLWLKAPGVGKTGSADVTATVPSWLQYDWTTSGTNTNPSARASFGFYSGSPRQIFLREVY